MNVRSNTTEEQSIIIIDSDEDVSEEIVEIDAAEYVKASVVRKIDFFKWVTNKRLTQKYKEDEDGMCAICYCNKDLWVSKCKHTCCYNCWKNWGLIRKTCPMCKRRFKITQLYFLS